jgi:hypothetical protein
MTVWLEPGSYRFAFEPSALDQTAWPLSLLGILLAMLLIACDRLRGVWPALEGVERAVLRATDWAERLSQPRWAWFRRATLVALGGLALLSVIYLAEWRPPLILENLEGAAVARVRFDFLEELSTARAEIEYPSRSRRCRRLGDRFACRNEDGNIDNEKYVASTPAEIEEYRMVRCIRARPEENARLDLVYPEVPAAQAIVGYYGVERAGRMMRLSRPVDFKIAIDGALVYEAATSSDNKMHWFKAPVGGPRRNVGVTFSVSALNVQKRFFCFYAQMADLRTGSKRSKPVRRSAGEWDDD